LRETAGGLYRSRLERELTEGARLFLSSLAEDEKILVEDIKCTMAHDLGLLEAGVIPPVQVARILRALAKLLTQAQKGSLKLTGPYEDVHELLEARVVQEAGMEAGGMMHAGRSRNDQVATDIRMAVREEILNVAEALLALVEELLTLSSKHLGTVMVLYTHGLPAQTSSFGHYLLSWADALTRDFERLIDCYRRVNLSPLGASAIAGSSFRLPRRLTARLLGFDGLVENSVDAITSRDFALETASTLAILHSNLSRVAEDLLLWSTEEFGYLEIADEYASPSSVMPQKKNPCTLELVRGRAGRAYGSLTQLLTIVKGLPTGYSRDLQETKPPLWASFNAVRGSLRILKGVFKTLKVNRRRMWQRAVEGFAAAPDLAERLTAECGISFRESHRLVGELVKRFAKEARSFRSLTTSDVERASLEVLARRTRVDGELISSALDPDRSLALRRSPGGPSPGEVRRMLRDRMARLNRLKASLSARRMRIEEADQQLMAAVKRQISSGRRGARGGSG